MEISRQIKNDKVPNLRDLGGMIGADGRRIRSGLLLRSEQLYNASQQDIALLEALPLKKIVDFRNPKEAAEKPDPEMAGCVNRNLSIIDESSLVSWEQDKSAQGQKDMDKLKDDPDSGAKGMREVYRNFIRMPFSRAQYARFLREILDTEDGAVLWHCTLGKDRCGWGSVLVQSLLGVSREAIIADYMYTNVCLKDEIAGMMAMLRKITANTNVGGAGSALVEAREEYIMAAFEEADKQYGSMDAYLEEGLGVDAEMRKRFRERFLEKA